MNSGFAGLCASLLVSIGLLAVPVTSEAANVGHYYNCAGEGTAAMANAITAAGHTPINVTVPDGATLAGLDVLWVNHNYTFFCPGGDNEWMANQAAINNAIQNGLILQVFDRVTTEAAYGTVASAYVPGASAITFVNSYTSNVDIPAGSPLLAYGINNTTLDGGNSSAHGYGVAVSLPAGATIWANDGTIDHAVMFSYALGAGTVIYSSIPLDFYMGGSNNFSNMLAPASVGAAVALVSEGTTCASEGYTYTKLEWCKNICEREYSGATLKMWIHRWIERYRVLPYCTVN